MSKLVIKFISGIFLTFMVFTGSAQAEMTGAPIVGLGTEADVNEYPWEGGASYPKYPKEDEDGSLG